jgi:hypothetical protein
MMTKSKFHLHPVIYEVLPFIYALLGTIAMFTSNIFTRVIGIALLSAAYIFICMRNHYRVEHGVDSWLTRSIFKKKL